ncbi:hypothetical protein ACHHYP_16562 [Achlya hypogyna]|uniref:Uncharacterized protein n=1 Tax=Achlya hypogyna TaxID=1202772 RepID=A0A1V9ZE48_ACHHY|nr:hypothetical protein ACHHYP_16562 [Achlya hypogyna]
MAAYPEGPFDPDDGSFPNSQELKMMLFPTQTRIGRGLRRSREDSDFACAKRMKHSLADNLTFLHIQPPAQTPMNSPEPVWYEVDQVSSPEVDDVDMDMEMDDAEVAGNSKLQLVPYDQPKSYPTLKLATPAQAYQASATNFALPNATPAETSTAIVLYRPPRRAEWKTEPESDSSDQEDDFDDQMMDIDDL